MALGRRDTRHARGWPIAAKHDGVGVDGVNLTLRIAAINAASRNGGIFLTLGNTSRAACVGRRTRHFATNGPTTPTRGSTGMPKDPEQAAGLEAVQRAADYDVGGGH